MTYLGKQAGRGASTTTLERGADMNDDQVSKQIDAIQISLRQTRAEVSALHNRMGILEHRLDIMDVRIVEGRSVSPT
jgi:hypothetical protein